MQFFCTTYVLTYLPYVENVVQILLTQGPVSNFSYVIQGFLRSGFKGFHSSEPQNFVGSAEPMEPTLTGPLSPFVALHCEDVSKVVCIYMRNFVLKDYDYLILLKQSY